MHARDLLSKQDQICCAFASISREVNCAIHSWVKKLLIFFIFPFYLFSFTLAKICHKTQANNQIAFKFGALYKGYKAHFGTKFSLNAINDLMTPVFVTTTGQTAYHKQLKFSKWMA